MTFPIRGFRFAAGSRRFMVCNRRPGLTAVTAVWIFASFVLLPVASSGQANPIEIPAGTPLSVELVKHVPMRTGEALQGRLLYPVYVDNRMVIPSGTLMRGQVVGLKSDRSHRIKARLRGDFTPFHIPVVRFSQVVSPDGNLNSIRSDDASNGLPLLRLSPPPGKKSGSFIASQIAKQKQRLRAEAAVFTARGKADRLLQFLYQQLPYHPERIETNTAWMVVLADPLKFDPGPPISNGPGTNTGKNQQPGNQQSAPPPHDPEIWQIRAYLQQSISSSDQKPGNRFDAVVTEPVFNADHTLAVPQGSVLIGEITQAKPARSFGRAGKLRFHFRQLKLPAGFTQPVEGTLSGIDSNKSADLKMDSEGGIAPQSQNRAIVPLALGLLAGRAFDDDGNKVFNNGIASNGFGIVGRLVGILANSRNVAAGIGFYAAGLSIYDLWLARGRDVSFVKNTRIEVTTTPGRNQLRESGTKGKAAGFP